MDQHLKQRLVGVAVIFLLAVIFLPMLLDGSGYQHEQVDVEIPPPPQVSSRIKVEEKVIELKKQAEDIPPIEPFIVDEVSDPPDDGESDVEEKVAEASPESGDQKAEAETKQVEKPAAKPAPAVAAKPEKAPEPKAEPKPAVKPEKKSGGESWVIQVGSFSDKNKAYAQRDKLRKSNLAAVFIEKFEHQGSTRYRVRMGPFITREKGVIVNNKLMAKHNIKGLVMHYEK